VSTMHAGKLHAALDALDFVGFHCFRLYSLRKP
jgi:hypothetical protein